MKKVILEDSESATVFAKDVHGGMYIGIKRDESFGGNINNRYGFIMRDKFNSLGSKSYDGGCYKGYAVQEMTMGNGWGFLDSFTLDGAIRNALLHEFEVFVFETHIEFLTWLVKELSKGVE